MQVNEIFYSVQGEGLNIGMPQIFIRLFGCNLRCPWCDSKFSYEGDNFETLNVRQIMERIGKYPCKAVSITGGEPLVQKEELLKLVKQLKADGYYVQLHTNGTIWAPEIFKLCDFISMDMKAPSAGMKSNRDFMQDLWELPNAYGDRIKFEVKVVVQTGQDLAFALRTVYTKCPTTLIVQPCVVNPEKEIPELQKLIEKILTFRAQDIRILPQLQKLVYPKYWRGK